MSKTKKKIDLVVYTDGSCIDNGRKTAVGGIGIHFPNKELKDVSKVYRLGCCTNQKAELYAILTALRYIKHNLGLSEYRIIIKTDSQYSIDCVTKWINGWKKNGWKTKTQKPVQNKEFIELINKYYERYDIIFEHVDAHMNIDTIDSKSNAIADELAVKASNRALSENKKELSIKNIINNMDNDVLLSKKYGKTNTSGTLIKKNISNFGSKRSKKNDCHSGFPYDPNFIVELVKSKQ